MTATMNAVTMLADHLYCHHTEDVTLGLNHPVYYCIWCVVLAAG